MRLARAIGLALLLAAPATGQVKVYISADMEGIAGVVTGEQLYRPAEVLAYLPIVERVDAHAVRFRGRDMLEVARFLEFVLNFEPGLSP